MVTEGRVVGVQGEERKKKLVPSSTDDWGVRNMFPYLQVFPLVRQEAGHPLSKQDPGIGSCRVQMLQNKEEGQVHHDQEVHLTVSLGLEVR